jgi:hypothetical protein
VAVTPQPLLKLLWAKWMASALIRAEPDHPLGRVHRFLCFYDLDCISSPPRR